MPRDRAHKPVGCACNPLLQVAEHKRAVDKMLEDKRAMFEAAQAAEEQEEAARCVGMGCLCVLSGLCTQPFQKAEFFCEAIAHRTAFDVLACTPHGMCQPCENTCTAAYGAQSLSGSCALLLCA